MCDKETKQVEFAKDRFAFYNNYIYLGVVDKLKAECYDFCEEHK